MRDKSLSPSARFFYCALDDLGGFKGESWYQQSTLAERFGVAPRSIREWLVELRQYVTVLRRPRAAIYLLNWAPRDRRNSATRELSDRRPGATLIGGIPPLTIPYMNQEIEPSIFTCEKCEDFGFIAGVGACTCSAGAQVSTRLRRKRA